VWRKRARGCKHVDCVLRGALLPWLCCLACTSEPLSDIPPGTVLDDTAPVEGARCLEDWPRCLSAQELLICEDWRYRSVKCADYCAERHATALGCESGWSAATCVCGPPPFSECSPGTQRCLDDDRWLSCDDSGRWQEASCTILCAQLSSPKLSAGCHISGSFSIAGAHNCQCTLAGLPCEGSAVACDSESTLLSCVDGVWQDTDCSQEVPSADDYGYCEVGLGDEPDACTIWEFFQ
jgi:hypothetical protein